MSETKVKSSGEDIRAMIDTLVANAQKALDGYMKLDQEQVDKIVHSMALAGLDNHMRLAKMAVEETHRGVYEDKIIKNMFATEYIWHSIKYQKTVGIVDENEMEDYVDVAEPVGVVAGVTPVTNPTSTTLFKSLICAKTRNPIIFAFHPASQKCSAEAARIVRDAAVAAGAPEYCVQWIESPSIEATTALMNHPGVSLILATGGTGMVKSAYSAGKPALGVGPGNVPCYIEKSADLERACNDLIISKTFDNGMICASEQAVIVDREISAEFEKIMTRDGCYFTNKDETKLLSDYCIKKDTMMVNPVIVGQSPVWIAAQAGFKVPAGTKILIAKLDRIDYDVPLAHEKLSPVLAYHIAGSTKAAFAAALKMLEIGGMGHSAVIHSSDDAIIEAYGEEMKVGRVIANSPSSQGAIGDIYNTNTPSLTLGCGSYGHNSTSQNVSSVNLINKKRLAKRRVNMQWFKVPPKIYFEYDAVQYLEKMPDISRAFIVTDPMMVKLGNVDKVLFYLRKREEILPQRDIRGCRTRPVGGYDNARGRDDEAVPPGRDNSAGRRFGDGRGQGHVAVLRAPGERLPRAEAQIHGYTQACLSLPRARQQVQNGRYPDDLRHRQRGHRLRRYHRQEKQYQIPAHRLLADAGRRHSRPAVRALHAQIHHGRHRPRCAHARDRGLCFGARLRLHRRARDEGDRARFRIPAEILRRRKRPRGARENAQRLLHRGHGLHQRFPRAQSLHGPQARRRISHPARARERHPAALRHSLQRQQQPDQIRLVAQIRPLHRR
jgi:acyl-CoA reductase-like NAD-dependent aldehyde dehydrogenase